MWPLLKAQGRLRWRGLEEVEEEEEEEEVGGGWTLEVGEDAW